MKQKSYKQVIKELIANKTGFNIKYIKLLTSSYAEPESEELDKHEFEYKGTTYQIIKNKLKTNNN